MTPKVRFAPSPTGLLHIGNVRTALLNVLFARRHDGHFLLRFDDTDRERSRDAYAEAIREDLRWLGLFWDSEAKQSDRLARYREAFETLRAAGRLYPCYETPEELEYKRKRQRARGEPPIYDRAALALTVHQRERLVSEGRPAHWRFLLQEDSEHWNDLVRGDEELRPDHMSDPIVIRADGTFLYMLPSVVDDIDLGITHVIRGEDHVANTGVQIQMFAALDVQPPGFAHIPLLTDIAGRGLSKRLGSLTVRELRDTRGIEAMALNSYLARLGTGEPSHACLALDDLAHDFDFGRFGRATPKFDEEQLERVNAELLHASPYAAVASRLAALGLDRADATFWEAVRGNLGRLDDARRWHDVCFGEIAPAEHDPAGNDPMLLSIAAALLPPEPWNASTWDFWTRALRDATGRRGKALFLPLRLALTGAEHGPELRALLPLIGRRRAERRLQRSGSTQASLAECAGLRP